LEEKAPATAVKSAEEPAEDLDLVFDDQPSARAANAKPTPPSENQEHIMLDIETLLEEGEEQKPAAAATEELDLDFAPGPARANASDLEIEIEPVDDGSTLRLRLPAGGHSGRPPSLQRAWRQRRLHQRSRQGRTRPMNSPRTNSLRPA
jgi:hypothetical protein